MFHIYLFVLSCSFIDNVPFFLFIRTLLQKLEKCSAVLIRGFGEIFQWGIDSISDEQTDRQTIVIDETLTDFIDALFLTNNFRFYSGLC